jgi:hypothetical protein
VEFIVPPQETEGCERKIDNIFQWSDMSAMKSEPTALKPISYQVLIAVLSRLLGFEIDAWFKLSWILVHSVNGSPAHKSLSSVLEAFLVSYKLGSL